jgi:hypothetical protein
MVCGAFGDEYLAPETSPEGCYTTDEVTRNMVGYKERCEVEDCDDAKDVLGMSWDTFQKNYPLVMKKLVNKLVEEAKDVRGLFGSMPVEYGECWGEKVSDEGKPLAEGEKEYFVKNTESHKLEDLVYFAELKIYGRKD